MLYRLSENERAVIYTMGRISSVKGPGTVFVMPGLQTMKRVDVSPAKVESDAAVTPWGLHVEKVELKR